MQIRKAIVAACSAGIALVPMSAKAACQTEIYADRAISDGMSTQVTGRTDSTVDGAAFTYAYTAETTNAVLANLIFAAVASHNRLFVIGSAASCPTTGAFRDMGTISQLFQQP